MDLFGQETPMMNFEGKKTIQTGCGTCCSIFIRICLAQTFINFIWSKYNPNYNDLNDYTHEEQDRGVSDFELTDYLIAF